MKNKKFMVMGLWFASLVSACGSSNSPVSTVAANLYPGYYSCPAGAYNFGTGCGSYGGTFESACMSAGGVIGVVSGVNVCRTLISPMTSSAYSLNIIPQYSWGQPNMGLFFTGVTAPILTGGQSYTGGIGVPVRAGDYVYYNGSSKYGQAGTGGIFNNPCNDNDGSSLLTATDGTETFPLTSGTARRINHDGVFRFGFDIPNAYNYCAEFNVSRFYIAHCQSAAGTVYECQ